MLGWARLADLCITVLNQARKGEFTNWDSFPAQLKQCHATSSAAMSAYLDELRAGPATNLPPSVDPNPAARPVAE
jgi:hypothetical protein